MKTKFLLFSFFALGMMLGGCSNDDVIDDAGGGNDLPPIVVPDKPANPNMKTVNLSGTVIDETGLPINGVRVASGDAVTYTNKNGMFVLTQAEVIDKRAIVTFSKDYYFTNTRSSEIVDGEQWNVCLSYSNRDSWWDCKINRTISSNENAELETQGLTITIPKDSYVNAETGEPYTGEVKAIAQYIEPNTPYFSALMPGGDLSAIRTNGDAATLISYGMVNVSLTDTEGNRLQITKEAELTFDVPYGFSEKTPDTMPLWYYDEDKGIWVEEGEATLTDGKYVGKVKHFSWWNLDYPAKQGTVTGTVTDEGGTPIAGVVVKVGQLQCITNAKGVYTQTVPADEAFEIYVVSSSYGDYSPLDHISFDGVAPRQKATVDIKLPSLPKVKGKVVGGNINIASVWIEYDRRNTKSAISTADGNFSIVAPYDYKGQATLWVMNADGKTKPIDITLDGKDLNLGDIDFAATGSVITIRSTNNNETTTLTVPSSGEIGDQYGATISGSNMTLNYYVPNGESADKQFYLYISRFSTDCNNYSNCSLNIISQGKQYYLYNVDAAVYIEGDNVIANVFGEDGNTQVFGTVTIPIYSHFLSFNNVSINELAGIPSFTPYLDKMIDYAIVYIKSSNFKKSCMLEYSGVTEADFKTIKKRAESKGLTKVEEDTQDWGGHHGFEGDNFKESQSWVTYFKDGKYIGIEYMENGRGDDIDRRIMVNTYEGISQGYYENYLKHQKYQEAYASKRNK